MTYRLLLLAYLCLGALLPAAGRPWLAVPLCLTALLAIGVLWTRALTSPSPPSTGSPSPGSPLLTLRAGLAASAGLVTLPLLAVLLHAAGQPVRPVPLVVACAVLTTLLGTAAVVRERLAARRAPTPASLPAQRNGSGSPTDQPDGGPSATDRPDSGPSATGPSATDENPASGYGHPPTTDDPPSRYAESAAPEPGYVRTTVAVAVPVVLAVAVGTVAVRAYLTMPSPAEPGYLSVALNGWAADIDRPVTVPRSGLVVPVRVASAGLDDVTAALRLRVGGRVVTTKPLTVTAETVRSVGVYVPALPADGCLHAVDISIGATSTGFYARGAALTVPPAVPGRIAGAVPAGAAGSIARPRGAAVTVPPAVPGRIAGAVPAGAAGSIARPAPAAGVRRAAC